MVSLKDLKENILKKEFTGFYVFYGEDYGLRKHYVDKIAESYDDVICLDNTHLLSDKKSSRGLFKTKHLYLIYGDTEFAKSRSSEILGVIKGMGDDCTILCYEQALTSSNLFKNFQQYITYFPRVQDKIAYEFIDSEAPLTLDCKAELARNCENDYANILLETDKINNYAEAMNMSKQTAYKELMNQNQLLYKYPEYKASDMMDDILQGNLENLVYWDKLLNTVYKDSFWIMLSGIFNDYNIAYLVKQYGKWEGSRIAYNINLPWNRTKTIRDFNLGMDANYYLDCAYQVADLDYKVKTGRLSQDKLFDVFFTTIL